MGIISQLRGMLTPSEKETIQDFLGVAHIDDDTLVVGNHIVAVVQVSGTDHTSTSADQRKAIRQAYLDFLNNGGISFQELIDIRPINWQIEYLDEQERMAAAARDAGDSWAWERFTVHRRAVLAREIKRKFGGVDVLRLRQYVVVPYYMGEVTYYPPRRSWRFWESVNNNYNRRNWRQAIRLGRRQLTDQVHSFQSFAQTIGLETQRLSGLELTQLLHLLWRGPAAYDEWISSAEELHAIMDVQDDVIPLAGSLADTSETKAKLAEVNS